MSSPLNKFVLDNNMNPSTYNITAVERETGLAKETLRVWERRYGFPQPERDIHGERSYPASQVERLRLIARLIRLGQRPGRLMQYDNVALTDLLAQAEPQQSSHPSPLPIDWAEHFLAPLKAHDMAALAQLLAQQLARQGLSRFVLDTVAPLTEAVGLAWMRGELAVFEEHLYTEQIKRLLRQAIISLPAGQNGPRVLLTTVPGEQHLLGLLMVETLLVIEGASCMALGTQTPLPDIVQAADVFQADIVALSFSAAFPQRQLQAQLEEIRAALPASRQLWVGGAGAALMRQKMPTGVRHLQNLPEMLAALSTWRQQA